MPAWLRFAPPLALAWLLAACGGGGGGAAPAPVAPTAPPSGGGATSGCSVALAPGPYRAVWPGAAWRRAAPQSQGLCPSAVAEALDYAFKDGNHTGAALVARNGYLVAERYAADRDASDLATSWSVAKSFASALLGVAWDEGLLGDLETRKVADFVPDRFAADWRDTAKSAITLWHLTNLRTGLGRRLGVVYYDGRDQLALALTRRLAGRPGEKVYDYSDGDVMIAGQVVKDAAGMDADRYLQRRVGGAIGFRGEWWRDAVGNVMTYCCLDATPRDFLRFGLLYARDGRWNGAALLSPAWIERSTAAARSGQYAFYWWPAPPRGAGYAAVGLMGQLVAVYPDEDLVVARFSRYRRAGDGRPVKTGGNYHETIAPADFDNAEFLRRVYAALDV